jgi:hypothetical protein
MIPEESNYQEKELCPICGERTEFTSEEIVEVVISSWENEPQRAKEILGCWVRHK